MNETYDVMVVEDDTSAAKVIEFELKAKGYNPRCFENAEEGLMHFTRNSIDLVLVDYTLPGMNGEEFYRKVKEINPLTPVIFMTALKSVEKAVKLIKMGAYSYLTKPLNIDDMHSNIEKALENVTLVKEHRRLKDNLSADSAGPFNFDNFVFNSERMRKLLHMVTRVASSSSNILITGESGTGKDVVANIIHSCSDRIKQPLVKVNLSALPPTLIESELFGAVKGAYTGAMKDRPGKFEEADKGTLFLDEIGELSIDIQVKLLRVIQDREITRLGSNRSKKVDIRLITATNKNLEGLVEEGKFRQDLYYRLNVINIDIPPLRERKEEIPLLVDLFIKKFNQRENKSIGTVSKDALNALLKYSFPGNIRELENIVERASVLAQSDVLGADDLPLYILSQENFDAVDLVGDTLLPLPERLTAVEKSILEKTLKKYNYHQTNAARELGISEGCLRYKIRTLGIRKDKNKSTSAQRV
jgi:two-component system, NtrC family, response regulator AtoC